MEQLLEEIIQIINLIKQSKHYENEDISIFLLGIKNDEEDDNFFLINNFIFLLDNLINVKNTILM